MDAPIPFATVTVRRCSLLVACALAGVTLVVADEVRTHLQVGASVAPQARLDAHLPPQVLVTAHDVGRGFVIVAEPGRLDVRTNAHAFALDVEPLGVPFSAVAISGLEQPVEFGSDGGSIVRRVADASRPVALVLYYRLRLDSSAAPGAYAWPVRFAVRPLQLQ
ncbi:MAG: hypothetical protein U1F06_00055 [Steroidobacteraceae bacterium]